MYNAGTRTFRLSEVYERTTRVLAFLVTCYYWITCLGYKAYAFFKDRYEKRKQKYEKGALNNMSTTSTTPDLTTLQTALAGLATIGATGASPFLKSDSAQKGLQVGVQEASLFIQALPSLVAIVQGFAGLFHHTAMATAAVAAKVPSPTTSTSTTPVTQ